MNRFKTVYDHIIGAKFAISQEDFARKADISRTIVSQLLTGKRIINEKQIMKICSAFPFVNEEWLRGGEGEAFSSDYGRLVPPEQFGDINSMISELNGFEDEKAYLLQLEIIALSFSSKMKEVQDLYSQLADLMNRLQVKEKENSSLNERLLSYARTIQRQHSEISELRSKVGADHQPSDVSSEGDVNT